MNETCDRCGSRAYTRWGKVDPTGRARELTYCGHHTTIHEPGLRAGRWVLLEDHRALLSTLP